MRVSRTIEAGFDGVELYCCGLVHSHAGHMSWTTSVLRPLMGPLQTLFRHLSEVPAFTLGNWSFRGPEITLVICLLGWRGRERYGVAWCKLMQRRVACRGVLWLFWCME